MSRSLFVRVVCLYFLPFFICNAWAGYKIRLTSLEKCKVEPNRQFKNPPLTYTVSARKVNRQTTLIQANFSVTAREGPVFFGVKGYQVKQSSSKDLILSMEKVSCSNPLTHQLIEIMNLKLDDKCFSVPGNYSTNKININEFGWLLTKAMIGPGKYSYDLEIGTNKGIAACISLVCDIYKA